MSESIGQLLARMRAERGLDVAKVAQELRCDRAIIDALEADRYADLGAAVFARGHLRRYADLLGAPTDGLLARWSAEQAGGQPLPDLTRAPQAPRPLDTRRWGRSLAVVAGALAIGLAAWWILQGAGARPEAAVDPSAADLRAATPPTQAVAVTDSAAVAPPTALPEGAPPAVSPPAVSPPAVTPTAVSPPAATSPAATSPTVSPPAVTPPASGGIELAFSATTDCWAEVVDAEGARRLYGMIRAGERVTAYGAPPLRVTLGRGDATRVEVGGRAVTIPQDAVRNAVARFEVAASGAMRALPPVPAPDASPAVAPAAAPPAGSP
ncbi:MAG: RodZ domain-containing protein [Gammaproteobacteria bacterium]